MTDERIKCPFCGEQIAPSAIKCRFCREWIGDPNRLVLVRKKGSSAARAVSKGIKERRYSRVAFNFKCFLLFCGLMAVTMIVVQIISGPFHLQGEKADAIASFILIPMWIIVGVVGLVKFADQYYKE